MTSLAQPRSSTPATAGVSQSTTVTPVSATASVAWPTRMPGTSVITELGLDVAGAGLATDVGGRDATGGDLGGDVEAALGEGPDERLVMRRARGIEQRRRRGLGHGGRLGALGSGKDEGHHGQPAGPALAGGAGELAL